MLPLLVLMTVDLAPETPGVEYRQPQLAAQGDLVAVAFGSGNTVRFAGSRDGGRTFSRPVIVAEVEKLALGRHRGPRVALAGDSIVIAAISGGELLSWRSTDSGRTWARAVRVNDVPTSAREGLHALAAGRGIVYTAWLDLRTKGMKLFGAASRDGGRTWSKNRLLYESPDGHICECCHPSVEIGDDGRIYAMWRNWLGGNRDMYLAISTDGGESFREQKLGKGSWPLKACPMDGGGLAVAGSEVTTVWRREQTVYKARAGAAEEKLGLGRDAAIAMAGGKTYIAWSSAQGLQFRAGGSKPFTRPGAFVDLATAGDKVVAAWEHDGRITLEVLP
ncbi:MAG: sialidase family protein [Bryobacteraceae bacterium]